MTEHANAELFRRSYAAFQAGDLDTVRSLLADDVVWHNPGSNHLSGTTAVLTRRWGCS